MPIDEIEISANQLEKHLSAYRIISNQIFMFFYFVILPVLIR